MNDLRALLLEVTQRCNADCAHCGSGCSKTRNRDLRDELTAGALLACLRDVKEGLGTDMMLNVSGGEPLMRADLFDIMGEAAALGFDWGMVTNGTLITDDTIRRMGETGMKTITVSIDGLAETHESLRGLPPGSFDRILANLRKLKAARFLDHLQVTFTANKRNVGEFPALYQKLDRVGLDSIRVSCVDPIGRAAENDGLLLDRGELETFIAFLNAANRRRGHTPVVWGCCHYLHNKLEGRTFRCDAGTHFASILCNGDIFVCPNVPRRPELIQGNIERDSFSEVWKTGFRPFRHRETNEECRTCRYYEGCKGDSLHTWDFERDRPNFCYKRIFCTQEPAYLEDAVRRLGPQPIDFVVAAPERADTVYLEPEAYEDIRRYFHFGRRSPLSLWEQQMGLVGFKLDDSYVVKYVFPSYICPVGPERARFAPATLRQARTETERLRRCLGASADRDDFVGEGGLRFLGFVHSHPAQPELCYSVGDERIHRRLCRRLGDYIGILVNPMRDTIGAYYGDPIRQADLVVLAGDRGSMK